MATIESVNPATGEVVSTWEVMDRRTAGAAIAAAADVQRDWARTPFAKRAEHLRRAAQVLREGKADLARLMMREMGKRLGDGENEVEKCAWVCEFYADQGEAFLADEPIDSDASRSYVHYEPLGVVLAVMPWNFPLWQVFRFLAPALMAGNAGVLKHASNVTGSAFEIERVVRDAGFPENLFRSVVVPGDRVAELIEHPGIAAVTLTGSTPAGRSVASTAGQVLKKCVLELGGSDPYLLLHDADFESAIDACVQSRLINAGQSCIAAKRFILPESERETCERLFVEKMSARRLGDPADPDTGLGPMARADLRDELHEQVQQSIAKGARCLVGGEKPGGPGAWYPATVLSDVAPGMPAYDDELFGPVASLIFVPDEDEAVRVANDTPFGLGAAVFSRDSERAERLAATRIEAGCCFVNDFVRSDPRLPFGGVKDSGFGRELGPFGIREFVNVKTVWVK